MGICLETTSWLGFRQQSENPCLTQVKVREKAERERERDEERERERSTREAGDAQASHRERESDNGVSESPFILGYRLVSLIQMTPMN